MSMIISLLSARDFIPVLHLLLDRGRDAVRVEINDLGDEVIANDRGANGLPVRRLLVEHEANALQAELDQRWRIDQGAQLHNVLALY